MDPSSYLYALIAARDSGSLKKTQGSCGESNQGPPALAAGTLATCTCTIINRYTLPCRGKVCACMHMHNEPKQWTEIIMGHLWDGLVPIFKTRVTSD